MKFSAAFSTLALLSVSSAHFILTYPASRGFNEDVEPTGPCGSFNTVSNRTQFPLSKGFLEINSGHVSATLQVNLVLNSSPADADFTSAAKTPVVSYTTSAPGNNCLPVDLSSFTGAANNVNATIQVVFNGGDGPLYQCTDVVLVTSAPSFNTTACANVAAAPQVSTPATTPTGTSAASAFTLSAAFSAAMVAGAALLVL